MDLSAAQHTQVVRLEKLLSLEEINAIHDAARAVGPRLGSEYRKSDLTWSVLFLHTDGLFRQLLPELHTKLRQAACRVFAEQSWGAAAQFEGAALRCAEYHTMGERGLLNDPGHYDLGSLVTLDVMLARPGEDFDGGVFRRRSPAARWRGTRLPRATR